MARMFDHEEELIRRAWEGNANAVQALYRLSFGRIYDVCFQACRNHERAVELVAEMFDAAMDRLRSLADPSGFRFTPAELRLVQLRLVQGHMGGVHAFAGRA